MSGKGVELGRDVEINCPHQYPVAATNNLVKKKKKKCNILQPRFGHSTWHKVATTLQRLHPTVKYWLNIFIFKAEFKIKIYETLSRVRALQRCSCFVWKLR